MRRPSAGKADQRGHKRGEVVVPPGDADFLDDRLLKPDAADAGDRMRIEFLGGQEGEAQSALHHIERGGGAGGTADDVRLEAGLPAGGKAEL